MIRNVGLAAICALLVNVLVNLRAGQRTEALICGLGVVGAVGSVALARRPATQRRAAHYLLGLAWLVVTSAGMVGPGFYHSGSVYLLTLGSAGLVMLGVGAGIGWGLAASLGLGLLAWVESDGVLVNPATSAQDWVWLDLVDYAISYVLLVSFTLFFHRESRRATERLAEQNLALAEENKQRRAAELEARAATSARAHFLATISHEIRTPMNSILGMASEIGAGELPGEQRERLELLERSAKSLLGLLSDLLDYSRLESGKVTLELRAFSLVGLAEEIVRLYRPLAAPSVELRLVLGSLESPTVRGDELRCRQILQNLLSNALKFTKAGSIELRISSSATGLVRVEVVDTGPGIAPQDLARLGEPFEQANAGVARRHGGTGLGLAIVKRLAEAMGGRLTIASTEGVGSSFCVELALPSAMLDAEVAVAAAEEPVLAEGLRVLVCEDNLVNQRVILGQLRRLAVDCEIVADGRGAVRRALDAGPFAALLLDYQLPDIDGPEVARAIRLAEPSGRHLPIIGLSANALADDRQSALAAGMDDYLTKPVGIDQLRRTLARWAKAA